MASVQYRSGTYQTIPHVPRPAPSQGLLPGCLLEAFHFWQGDDLIIRGEPVDMESPWFQFTLEIRSDPSDRDHVEIRRRAIGAPLTPINSQSVRGPLQRGDSGGGAARAAPPPRAPDDMDISEDSLLQLMSLTGGNMSVKVWGPSGDGVIAVLRRRGATSRSTGHSGRQKAATRRSTQREERVTVQGPVKKQQLDGMSHGGGNWHKASVSDCLPLAAPVGLSPLLILTLCGSERVFVVSGRGGGGAGGPLPQNPLPPPPRPK